MNFQNVFRIKDGDPNGKVMAESPAVCYGDDGSFWVKTNDGFNFNGWVSLLED